MKLLLSKQKLFCLTALLGIMFSLQADDFEDNDYDSSFVDWSPDVTSDEFGTGRPAKKVFALEEPKRSEKNLKKIIAAEEDPLQEELLAQEEAPPRTILINFNNVAITEFIRFISRISGKNFVYDEGDLQFNVTIVSDEPATLENVMAALMQILRIHNLSLMEQGNNIIIHTNAKVNSISKVVSDGQLQLDVNDTQLVTQVFKLNTLDTDKAVKLIQPLISAGAIVDQIPDASNVVVTDITVNVQKIGQLLKSLDSPASGLIIGQYQVVNALLDSILPLAERIMQPIAEGKPLVFVPHTASNSVFIVSTPFLVERAIAIFRNLDVNTGATRIFTNENLRFSGQGSQGQAGGPGAGGFGNQGGLGGFNQGQGGPGGAGGQGAGGLGTQGGPGAGGLGGTGVTGPDGQGLQAPNQGGSLSTQGGTFGGLPGTPGFQGAPGYGTLGGGAEPGFQGGSLSTQSQLEELRRQQGFSSGSIGFDNAWTNSLPLGHIQRTQFYIQKLRFRDGQQIQDALARIADSLQRTGQSNADLVATIYSIQWIEASNSLVFTGTQESLLKVRELITEIDTPLRQVFIEMLIMETTIDDSLDYGVNWGARFGGGNQSGAENFISQANPLSALLDTAGFQTPGSPQLNTPDASVATRQNGYSLGIVGRKLTHRGTEYASIGALVRAVHDKTKSNIVMNPKILTEDNVPAEIFVGINTRFQTQSISNDQGNIVTNNFEFRDVGTTLKVTPLLSNNDIVTLEIKQEVSRVLPDSNTGGGGLANLPAGPSTSKNTTTTRVHVPNKYFLVISGMIQEQRDRFRTQVPCLGGAPVIGALASEKTQQLAKRNLMIFIRPEIIDTEEEIEHLTRHQQNIFRQKLRTTKMWQLETDEAMDWMNIQKPDNCFNDIEEYNP